MPYKKHRWIGWMFALPALIFYCVFSAYPILLAIHFSFYNWNGIGEKTWAGINNYINVFKTSEMVDSLIHAFILVFFFSVIPVFIALVNASVIREIRNKFIKSVTQTVLFLPQIIPGAAAAVAWTWMYSQNGTVNQILSFLGLESITRAWLGDFTWALPAVGVIGIWLETGFCSLLLMSGIGKIDATLYEAAEIDGASSFDKFRVVTFPGLRHEISICVMLTTIAALASFDIIYIATGGGPGYQTMVPGIMVYNLAFTSKQIGASNAMAIVLAAVVIAVIIPIQRIFKED